MRRFTLPFFSALLACLLTAMPTSPALARNDRDFRERHYRGHDWREWRHGRPADHYYRDCSVSYRGGNRIVHCHGSPWAYSYIAPPVVYYRAPITRALPLPSMPEGLEYGTPYQDRQGRYCREYTTHGMI